MKIMFRDKSFKYFTDYKITLIYNAVASTFSFNALSSVLGQPLVYSFVEIYNDNDELLITGYILSSGYTISEKPEVEVYPGYSISGSIEDCSVSYPLQRDGMTLREIAKQLLDPFGISFIVNSSVVSEMDKKYDTTTADDGQTVKDYLTELASQRGIVLTHNEKGQIVFTKIEPNKLKPVAFFKEGDAGATKISLTANGQQMHSEITVVRQASAENPDAGEYTIKNPYVTNRYRPITRVLNSGDIFDIQSSARNELAKELTGIEVQVETTKFIKPGQIIEIESERLKLRKPTRFFVEQTDINGTVIGETYTLRCVLPDVYSNEIVKNVFL